MAADPMACKVCNGKSRHVVDIKYSYGEGDPSALSVFLCSICGLLFIGEVTDAQLACAYGALDSNRIYEETAFTVERKISRALHNIAPFLSGNVSNPSLLDIGCGYGHLLDGLAESYPLLRLTGHELPGDSASVCRKKGYEVFTCPLEDLSGHFSVITLLDVAEHVSDPNSTFAEVCRLLNKDGYVYLHTPRRCFWDSIFLALIRIPGLRKLAWEWLRTRVSVFHLQLWTDKALKLSLRNAGFRIIYSKAELELSWPLERYANVYLVRQRHLPVLLAKVFTYLARFLFVGLGTMRNKSIVLAQKVGNVE